MVTNRRCDSNKNSGSNLNKNKRNIFKKLDNSKRSKKIYVNPME